MTNELSLYHNVLFLELRPWLKRDVQESKYKELLQSIRKEAFSFQPAYEVVFQKPLTPKRKYYHSIIENEATTYLNNFQNLIADAGAENEKKYWVHTTLTKVISQKLKEASKIIESNEYYLEKILPGVNPTGNNKNLLDETYILQYLKYQLVRIYLEIQSAFNSFLKEEEISEDELHLIYFSEQAPSISFINTATKIKLAIPASQLPDKIKKIQFTPRAFDFRADGKGIIEYSNIVSDPLRFSHFEEELFEHGLIDIDYNFPKRHGQSQELAAVFHTLIKKNYFHKKNFAKKVLIKPYEIRKFLDHRYQSNTYKQFMVWGYDSTKLANFVEERYWIDNLPRC